MTEEAEKKIRRWDMAQLIIVLATVIPLVVTGTVYVTRTMEPSVQAQQALQLSREAIQIGHENAKQNETLANQLTLVDKKIDSFDVNGRLNRIEASQKIMLDLLQRQSDRLDRALERGKN